MSGNRRVIVLPRTVGRGAGLGNEMISLGMAFLGAEAVGGKALTPAWGLNRGRYYDYFKTPRYDWIVHRLLYRLCPPSRVFTEEAYKSHFDPDYGVAFENWFRTLDLPKFGPIVVMVEGMWIGYQPLIRARKHLLGLFLSTRYTSVNLARNLPRPTEAKIRIGIHYRSGDFGNAWTPGDRENRWNNRLPLKWFLHVARELSNQFGDRAQFVLVTDGSPSEMAEVIKEFNPITTFDQDNTSISDMLLLSSCDVIIPSLSSFSMGAMFLGDAFYIWPYEHAINLDGWLSFWGDEDGPGSPSQKLTSLSEERFATAGAPGSRCLFLREEAPIPGQFVSEVRNAAERRLPFTDPLLYGVVKEKATESPNQN